MSQSNAGAAAPSTNSTPPVPPLTPEIPPFIPSESQTQLIWRQFRRRRLAVVSAGFILLLFTTSIFAPFLANGAPFWYYGYNSAEYQESLQTVRVLVDQLGKGEPAVTKPEPGKTAPKKTSGGTTADKLKIIRRQIAFMSNKLPEEKRLALEALAQRIEELVAGSRPGAPLNAETTAELGKIRHNLRQEFDTRNVQLVSSSHWPVLASLGWADVLFMVFNFLFLLLPAWGRLFRTGSTYNALKRQGRIKLAILFGAPVVCALAWWVVVPSRVDRTNYKTGNVVRNEKGTAESKARSTRGSEVMFEKVVWPPIPYALDQQNLDELKRMPDLYRILLAVFGRDKLNQDEKKWSVSGDHWLGTDEIGRDVTSRMIWGGRVSLAVGIVAVSIYVTIGVFVGAIAGYFRGVWDLVLSRIIEVVICFPSFFLILTIVSFLGPNIFNIMIVIGLIGWTGVAQLVRGEFLRLGEQEFILAGRALGFSPFRIIFRHVLPNALAPVLVSATFGIAGAILTESSLSFLGMGITVPRPSWGGILSSGREVIFEAPWLIYFPGFAIFLTITAYNLVGEALRDASDPRLRGGR